jgi:hypothetical protein
LILKSNYKRLTLEEAPKKNEVKRLFEERINLILGSFLGKKKNPPWKTILE